MARFTTTMGPIYAITLDSLKITWLLNNLSTNKRLYGLALNNYTGRGYEQLVSILREVYARDGSLANIYAAAPSSYKPGNTNSRRVSRTNATASNTTPAKNKKTRAASSKTGIAEKKEGFQLPKI
jgi:hypothetical protein